MKRTHSDRLPAIRDSVLVRMRDAATNEVQAERHASAEQRRTSIDFHPGGGTRLIREGGPRSGEDGVREVAHRVAGALVRRGALAPGFRVLLPGDPGADFSDATDVDAKIHGSHMICVQVTRIVPQQSYEALGRHRRELSARSTIELATDIRCAIEKKIEHCFQTPDLRRGITLALDALDHGAEYGSEPVVAGFDRSWAAGLGFEQIWVVAPMDVVALA